jgi:hypothetical protein
MSGKNLQTEAVRIFREPEASWNATVGTRYREARNDNYAPARYGHATQVIHVNRSHVSRIEMAPILPIQLAPIPNTKPNQRPSDRSWRRRVSRPDCCSWRLVRNAGVIRRAHFSNGLDAY